MTPVYQHPFEGIHAKTLAPFDRRFKWCQLLADDLQLPIYVSDIEKSLPKPSYTIDTLTELARRHPENEYRLVIGSDVLPDLDKWKDWERITSHFSPIVVGRLGYPCPPGVVTFRSQQFRD